MVLSHGGRLENVAREVPTSGAEFRGFECLNLIRHLTRQLADHTTSQMTGSVSQLHTKSSIYLQPEPCLGD